MTNYISLTCAQVILRCCSVLSGAVHKTAKESEKLERDPVGWTSGGIVKETRKWVCHIKNSQERAEEVFCLNFKTQVNAPEKETKPHTHAHTHTNKICSLMNTKTTPTARTVINLFFKTSRPKTEESKLRKFNELTFI